MSRHMQLPLHIRVHPSYSFIIPDNGTVIHSKYTGLYTTITWEYYLPIQHEDRGWASL